MSASVCVSVLNELKIEYMGTATWLLIEILLSISLHVLPSKHCRLQEFNYL